MNASVLDTLANTCYCLVSLKWDPIVVWICVPLMTEDVEHLCGHQPFVLPSLDMYLFRSFASFLLGFCLLQPLLQVRGVRLSEAVQLPTVPPDPKCCSWY